jgi:predicted hotdog family 3-hydroxylacyl-ACP dehydratase
MTSGQPDIDLYADLEKLIPQREPVVMIDGLRAVTDNAAVSHFTLRPDNLFVNDGRFVEAGLLENMAQTAAARSGLLSAKAGQAPPVGFIGGVKDLRVHRLPVTGEELETTVTVLHEVLNASVVKGEVRVKGLPVAECELKIFLNP